MIQDARSGGELQRSNVALKINCRGGCTVASTWPLKRPRTLLSSIRELGDTGSPPPRCWLERDYAADLKLPDAAR